MFVSCEVYSINMQRARCSYSTTHATLSLSLFNVSPVPSSRTQSTSGHLYPKAFWTLAEGNLRAASVSMVDLVLQASQAGCIMINIFSEYFLTMAATIQALQATVGTFVRVLRQCNCYFKWIYHFVKWKLREWLSTRSSKLKERKSSLYKFALLDHIQSIRQIRFFGWLMTTRAVELVPCCPPGKQPITTSCFAIRP